MVSPNKNDKIHEMRKGYYWYQYMNYVRRVVAYLRAKLAHHYLFVKLEVLQTKLIYRSCTYAHKQVIFMYFAYFGNYNTLSNKPKPS